MVWCLLLEIVATACLRLDCGCLCVFMVGCDAMVVNLGFVVCGLIGLLFVFAGC